MYLLFRYKNMLPSVFFERKYGEKKIIRAFMDYEIYERNEEAKAMEGGI